MAARRHYDSGARPLPVPVEKLFNDFKIASLKSKLRKGLIRKMSRFTMEQEEKMGQEAEAKAQRQQERRERRRAERESLKRGGRPKAKSPKGIRLLQLDSYM